jgi:hypothetical protein
MDSSRAYLQVGFRQTSRFLKEMHTKEDMSQILIQEQIVLKSSEQYHRRVRPV